MKRMAMAVFVMLCAAHIFAQTGVIKELTGTVEIKPAGRADFSPAKAGDRIARDTVVSTGFRSTAVITVGSSTITVKPVTRLTLEEISAAPGTEEVNVNLQTGRLRVDVKPQAGDKASFSVKSPSSTASVRGTSFEFDTQRLSVMEGIVAFQGSKGRAVQVRAGGKSEVTSSGRAEDPLDVLEASLQGPGISGSVRRGSSGGSGGPDDTTLKIEFELSGEE